MLNKGSRTVAQTAALIMIMTLVSKFFGFIRELFMAGFYGTSYIVDAYVMANSIPGIILGGIFASIGTAYMPTFSVIMEREGQMAGYKFTDRVLTLCGLISILSIAMGIPMSNQLIHIFAKDFDVQTAELASFYLKITLSYVFFSSSISILSANLQYNGVFIRQIIGGYFLDFGIIIGIIVSGLYSHYYLAFGYCFGYLLYFLFVYYASRQNGYHFKLRFDFGKPIKRIFKLAAPVFIGTYITQINAFVDKMLASSLPEGSIAALNYGNLVVGLIITLTATAIITALYPKISQAVSQHKWDYFNDSSRKSLLISCMVGVPFCFGALAFADPVIQVIFERGAFSEASTTLTSQTFFFYSLGIPFMAFNAILIQVFYAMHDMKTPLIASAIGVVVNVTLNLILVGSMHHCGLALATSIANAVYTVALCVLVKQKHPNVSIIPNARKIITIVISSAIAVGIAVLVYRLLQIATYIRTLQLIIAVLAACVVYLIVLQLLKVEELSVLYELIPRRNGNDN